MNTEQIKYIGLHVKCPSLLSDINDIRILNIKLYVTQITNTIKIRPVEAGLFHTRGERT